MAQGITAVETKSERVLKCNATDTSITYTLPTAADSEGRKYKIIKVDSSSNTITIDPSGSETLNGDTDGIVLTDQYDSLTVISDGTEFFKVD